MHCTPRCQIDDGIVLAEVTSLTRGVDSLHATILLTWGIPMYANGTVVGRATESSTMTVLLVRGTGGYIVREVRPRRRTG